MVQDMAQGDLVFVEFGAPLKGLYRGYIGVI